MMTSFENEFTRRFSGLLIQKCVSVLQKVHTDITQQPVFYSKDEN